MSAALRLTVAINALLGQRVGQQLLDNAQVVTAPAAPYIAVGMPLHAYI